MLRGAVLHVHRADRADRLIGALAGVLAVPARDPFAPEVVAVPTRGVERWLTQRLSSHLGVSAEDRADGVCANVAFPAPRRLVDAVVAAASGFDADVDPWQPERMVWPLLEVVDAHLDEPWLARLAAHLDPERGDRSRRLRTVAHLATLYDRYALYRPALLEAWRDGIDLDGADPAGTLAAQDAWQAELWRALRARIAAPGPAERLAGACDRLLADPDLSDLPERVALFGLTALPARHLEVLRALADARDVHLFLLQPSDAAWRALAKEIERSGPERTRARLPRTFLPRHPLLASWGRDARELQMALATVADPVDVHHGGDEAAAPRASLLQRLQDDVRADRAPAPAPASAPDPGGDASLQVHACHGAGRQVEVLHDAILHALQDDPTLEPRDVIVMCPDIETFAPLIQATFGAGAEIERDEDDDGADDRPRLRVRLADRALRETNPVLGVVARLLELTAARVTASEVLDLADREPVRRRFRIGTDDMSRLEEWVAATGARWGLDAEHRAPYGLAEVRQGTWDAALDRLLAGVAMDEEGPRLIAGVLPLDDVDSAAIDLAGRFAEYVDRLGATLRDFAGAPRSADAWVEAIGAAADALTAPAPRDQWQRAELARVLAEVADEAAGSAALLDAADVAALLEPRLAGRPTRANFRTGHLTVCTLRPMRSVPHRVIALLGLDDTIFPRRSPRDGDDLLLMAPHVGDRDARAEDRQILLDALMAATDRLIITYTGNDERTNARRAPAVPVGELLDVVGRMTGDRDAVVRRHPLQPFDPDNFAAGGPWSFDPISLLGARALVGERLPRPPFLAGPLPPRRGDLIEVRDLIAFLDHPVRAFLDQRLGVGATSKARDTADALPVELGFLEQWRVGDRLLAAHLGGHDALGAERARGDLPPGAIGERALAALDERARAVVAEARRELPAADDDAPASLDVRVALPDGRTLGGTVPGLVGDVVRVVTFSRVTAGRRLRAWAQVLALTATDPERPFRAVTVGRPRRGAPRTRHATIATVPALLPDATAEERRDNAIALLAVLLDLYDRGMREPLPIYAETSAAYASGGRAGQALARKAWTTPFGGVAFEDRDEEHVLVLGARVPFEELLLEPPRDAEEASWADDRSRLGVYAHRLWADVREEVRDR
ncbi:MAG TPA: exodeoxyribonuclease V subunit gamma [Baekduia sp.]|uniref:exodeoxyribonuclease V subunit gamma n=1 Tax=Baekduia sp. TaxID=2600305 RepID=UPI002D79F328|nr:exodeoxyribonuclease V subunit gamma [Baekduia sp.]HET6505631.1 exodeoxyribonuclease V subunit gamma [Baekduia sp.]